MLLPEMPFLLLCTQVNFNSTSRAHQLAENAQPQATSVKTSELNPAATEFRPINYVSQSSSYSLSSMLHTENDAVVVANKKKDLTGSVGNKTPEVTPNNNVHRVTTTTTTNTTNKKLLPSGIGLSDDEDEEDSTMEVQFVVCSTATSFRYKVQCMIWMRRTMKRRMTRKRRTTRHKSRKRTWQLRKLLWIGSYFELQMCTIFFLFFSFS